MPLLGSTHSLGTVSRKLIDPGSNVQHAIVWVMKLVLQAHMS